MLLKKTFILFCFFCLFKTTLFAQEEKLFLNITEISYEQPAIKINITYKTKAQYLIVLKNDLEIIKETLNEKNKEIFFWISLSEPQNKIIAKVYSEQNELINESEPLIVDTNEFLPTLDISLNNNLNLNKTKILNGKINLSKSNTELQLTLKDKYFYTTTSDENGNFSFSAMHLTPGIFTANFILKNAWGESKSTTYIFLSLGDNKIITDFILVDKNEFQLIFSKNGLTKYTFPIALGTPRTPTKPGIWFIGKKELMPNPNTGWGVLRMLLYQQTQNGMHWSGYAIHGTNNPTSIGKEASHGCVRMFNEDVTNLSQKVPLGTYVFIK